jgi:long-chain acyl-CoA synthetase
MATFNKPWLAHYDDGVPLEIDIPELSLVDLFRDAVEEYGESIFTIYEGNELTYRQVDDPSDRVARFLLAQGLKKGDRVGILLPNTPAFVVSYYGILKAGGVVMALNPAYRSAEVKNQASESGIRFLILPTLTYEAIKPIQSETQIERVVIVGEEPGVSAPEDFTWEKMLLDFKDGDPADVPIKPDDPAVFQYSGGTIGTPKCVIGLHRNLDVI